MVLADSSIFIEGLKKESVFKDAKQILSTLIVNAEIVCINEKKKLNFEKYSAILDIFEVITTSKDFIPLWKTFIAKHNLKPHDAFILASCKYHGIPYLVSFDEDFKNPAKKEGIKLIQSMDELLEITKG